MDTLARLEQDEDLARQLQVQEDKRSSVNLAMQLARGSRLRRACTAPVNGSDLTESWDDGLLVAILTFSPLRPGSSAATGVSMRWRRCKVLADRERAVDQFEAGTRLGRSLSFQVERSLFEASASVVGKPYWDRVRALVFNLRDRKLATKAEPAPVAVVQPPPPLLPSPPPWPWPSPPAGPTTPSSSTGAWAWERPT